MWSLMRSRSNASGGLDRTPRFGDCALRIADRYCTATSVPALGKEVQARGVAWLHLPIVDNWIADAAFEASWDAETTRLHALLDRGGRILVHCKGGLGRAGMIATRLLIERGATAGEAIAAVRRTRPGAVENAAQEGYLHRLRRARP